MLISEGWCENKCGVNAIAKDMHEVWVRYDAMLCSIVSGKYFNSSFIVVLVLEDLFH